jgi:hypothetical protein
MSDTPFDDIDLLIASASPQERAALFAGLTARLGKLAAAALADIAVPPAPPRLTLTPQEVADQTGLTVAYIKKLSRLPSAKAWALHPTRKTLLIDPTGFGAALGKKSAQTVRIRPNPRVKQEVGRTLPSVSADKRRL